MRDDTENPTKPLAPEERRAIVADLDRIMARLDAAGEYIAAAYLANGREFCAAAR